MKKKVCDMLRTLIRWFGGLRIRNKLFLSNFILISLLVMVIFNFSFRRVNNALLEQARKEMDASILQLKDNLENRLALCEELSKSILYNQELLELLTAPYESKLDAYDSFKRAKAILRNMEIANTTVAGVSVYVFNRTFLADGAYFVYADEQIRQSEWFQGILHTNIGGVWQRTYLNTKDEPVIAYHRLLYEQKSSFQIMGILRIEVPERVVYDYIAAEAGHNQIYILDRDGYVITDSERLLLEQNIRGEAFIAGIYENGHGQYTTRMGGKESLVVYHTAHNGWKLAGVVPLDILKENARAINRFTLTVYAIAIVLLLVITYLVADRLTRGLHMLYDGVRKVQRGEYSHKVDIPGGDEVGELAAAYNQMTDELDYLFYEAYGSQIKMKELELKVLQSQVNPHFLNNVLSSIGWLALKRDAPEIRRMALETAKFYRFSLRVERDIVTLAEELEQVRSYVEIQKIRFPDCIDMNVDIEDALLTIKLRKLTLQPLVENCIIHGMREDGAPLRIYLRAFREPEQIVLEVEDDGLGIPEDTLAQLNAADAETEDSGSCGVRNVNERIKLHFGQQYGLSIHSEPDQGTLARIRLPVPEHSV